MEDHPDGNGFADPFFLVRKARRATFTPDPLRWDVYAGECRLVGLSSLPQIKTDRGLRAVGHFAIVLLAKTLDFLSTAATSAAQWRMDSLSRLEETLSQRLARELFLSAPGMKRIGSAHHTPYM